MGIVSHEFEQNIFQKKITALREKVFNFKALVKMFVFYPKT
jgi:hypothetical protein